MAVVVTGERLCSLLPGMSRATGSPKMKFNSGSREEAVRIYDLDYVIELRDPLLSAPHYLWNYCFMS